MIKCPQLLSFCLRTGGCTLTTDFCFHQWLSCYSDISQHPSVMLWCYEDSLGYAAFHLLHKVLQEVSRKPLLHERPARAGWAFFKLGLAYAQIVCQEKCSQATVFKALQKHPKGLFCLCTMKQQSREKAHVDIHRVSMLHSLDHRGEPQENMARSVNVLILIKLFFFMLITRNHTFKAITKWNKSFSIFVWLFNLFFFLF